MSVFVRDYEKRDAEEIVHLFYETVHSVNLSDYSPEQVEAWAPEIPDAGVWHSRLMDRKTFTAVENEEVVGFAELEESGHLHMFYVRKDVVGRGVGRLLYQSVEKKARDLGLKKVFTEASITARPFFLRRGFEVVREQLVWRRGVGLKNFAMEKPLNS